MEVFIMYEVDGIFCAGDPATMKGCGGLATS